METEKSGHLSDKFLLGCKTSPEDTKSVSSKCNSSNITEEEVSENLRHHWGKKAEYILAAVGYCVGLGNIWRFPYVCMRNGGGAFLIPFFLSLFICAMPVYFLESAMGQFNGKSSLHVWNMVPLFKGLGLSMNLLTFFCCWYYSIILAWALMYLAYSFNTPLPWTVCNQSWNTPNCFVGIKDNTSTANNTSIASSLLQINGSSFGFNETQFNLTDLNNSTDANVTKVSAAEEFWLHKVLERSSGLEDMGGLPWKTSLALVVANLVVLVGVIKGIRSTGKVVYVTATLPYLLLTIMLILGITLPGSGDGILFYIKPDFSKLMESQTWVDAFLQVFYSLGTGWGGLITMGSYNKFHNNCMRDSIILTICCEGTSVYGGFAIFAILGHMAYISGVPIIDFAKSGAGLAFIVYPTAISYLPLPQLWGVLFFLMLFLLGLDTQFTCIETVLTTAADIWVKLFLRWRKSISTLTMAFFTLAGLVFAARGGIYIFTLIDWYIAAFSLLIQSAMECLIIGWIYGADRFCHDIELMLGRKPYKLFSISWKFISPILLLFMFGVTLATFNPPTYGSYSYSTSAEVWGWIFSVAPFTLIIICAVIELMKRKGPIVQRIKMACQPTSEWGPADPLVREKYDFMVSNYGNEYSSSCDVECQDVLYPKSDVPYQDVVFIKPENISIKQ